MRLGDAGATWTCRPVPLPSHPQKPQDSERSSSCRFTPNSKLSCSSIRQKPVMLLRSSPLSLIFRFRVSPARAKLSGGSWSVRECPQELPAKPKKAARDAACSHGASTACVIPSSRHLPMPMLLSSSGRNSGAAVVPIYRIGNGESFWQRDTMATGEWVLCSNRRALPKTPRVQQGPQRLLALVASGPEDGINQLCAPLLPIVQIVPSSGRLHSWSDRLGSQGLKLGVLRFFAFGFGIHQRHTLRLVQIQSRLLGEWISAARLRANVWLRIKGDYPASGKLTLAGMPSLGPVGSMPVTRLEVAPRP
jgi:hypothetical protein